MYRIFHLLIPYLQASVASSNLMGKYLTHTYSSMKKFCFGHVFKNETFSMSWSIYVSLSINNIITVSNYQSNTVLVFVDFIFHHNVLKYRNAS